MHGGPGGPTVDGELRWPRMGGGLGAPSVRGGAGQDLTPGSSASDFSHYTGCPWALAVLALQQVYSELSLPFPLEPLSSALSSGIMHHTSSSSANLSPGHMGSALGRDAFLPGLGRALLPAGLAPREPPRARGQCPLRGRAGWVAALVTCPQSVGDICLPGDLLLHIRV